MTQPENPQPTKETVTESSCGGYLYLHNKPYYDLVNWLFYYMREFPFTTEQIHDAVNLANEKKVEYDRRKQDTQP
jgi:hypothetical protein